MPASRPHIYRDGRHEVVCVSRARANADRAIRNVPVHATPASVSHDFCRGRHGIKVSPTRFTPAV